MSDAVTLPAWLTPTLLGLVGLGVVWVIKTLSTVVTTLAEMRVTLFGAQGNNGLNGDVRAQRARLHDLANDVQHMEVRVAVLERGQAA